jgi:hypothetical protein
VQRHSIGLLEAGVVDEVLGLRLDSYMRGYEPPKEVVALACGCLRADHTESDVLVKGLVIQVEVERAIVAEATYGMDVGESDST